MSHELRTPLNAIIGFSDIMNSEVAGPLNNPQYKEFCQHIHESGAHLLELINDILDLSKIEAGKFELEENVVEPDQIIESSLRLVHGRAELHAISLEIDSDEDLPRFLADQRKIKQVLINLLSNAVKFTPDGARCSSAQKSSRAAISRSSSAIPGSGSARRICQRSWSPLSRAMAA